MKKCYLFVATCLLASSSVALANNTKVCPNNFEFVNDSMWRCTVGNNPEDISNCHQVPAETAYITQIGKRHIKHTHYSIQPGETDTSIPQVIDNVYGLGTKPHESTSSIYVLGCSDRYLIHIIQYTDDGWLVFSNADPRDHQ